MSASLPAARVLILEADHRFARTLQSILDDHETTVTQDVSEMRDLLATEHFDVMVVDPSQGFCRDVDDAIQQLANPPVLVALGDRDRNVSPASTLQVPKPFGAGDLQDAVRVALQRGTVTFKTDNGASDAAMIGRSAAMQHLMSLIRRVAPTRATVLITGETGTGKELVARAIHSHSPRARRPFVAINCSALPESLLESELFGHTRGSFTGAIANHKGMIESAHGGTLFLDEISTLTASTQVKLLRVIQERVIHRIGSTTPLPVDFRLIAATNTNLHDEVSAGRFRGDLFYRLNVFPVHVPPLRERHGDIALLVSYFRLRFMRDNGVTPPSITPDLIARLNAYDWPGNVRELENFVERAAIMYGGEEQGRLDSLLSEPPREAQRVLHEARERQWTLAQLEREYILSVLEQSQGQRKTASALLGIDRRTIYRKLKEWGLNGRFPAESDDLDDPS